MADNDSAVTFNGVQISGRGGAGISVARSDGQVQFDGLVSIDNSASASAAAIDISDSAADVVFLGGADVQDAIGDGGVRLRDNTGTATFSRLDVTATGAPGVLARSAGTLNILDGDVATENGAAFDLEDTGGTISLTSVNVTGGSTGIRLQDTTGSFVVNGDSENTPGSGGRIADTTTAVQIANAGVTGFRYMNLDGNATGVSIDTAERFAFWDGSVTDSTNWAIDASNVAAIEVVASSFSDNGDTFRLSADTAVEHSWLLSGLTVDSGTSAALLAEATNGADLNLTVQDSTFTSVADDVRLVDIQTSGQASVVLSGNRLQSFGDNVRLLNMDAGSSTDLALLTVFNNLFATAGSAGTGIRTTTAGPASIQYEQNTMTFAASRGTGMDFTLAGSSTVGLYTNLITDNFDGATAMLFRDVQGPSSIEFAGNEFQFANLGGLSDRGFIFETVDGDVNLLGSVNNLVGGASTPWFVPSGSTSGTFLVNGVRVP